MFRRVTRLRGAAVALAGIALVATTSVTAQAEEGIGQVVGPVVGAEQHPNGAAIDWSAVAGAGYGVAVMEATDGGNYRNPWFPADWSAARTAGLVRGSFAIGRPASPVVATARQQADYYLARLGGTSTASRTLPPALYLASAGGLSRSQLVTWTQTFLLRVRSATGRVPMLRTFAYFWQSGLGDAEAFSRFPVWLDSVAPPPATTAIWTHTSTAEFPGVPVPSPAARVTADPATWTLLRDGRLPGVWPDAPPGPVRAPSVKPYDGAAVVSWLPPDAGSSSVTAYHVVAHPFDVADPQDIAVTVPGDVTQATVRGLANGVSYTFTVSADNAVGPGAPSQPGGPSTPATTAGAVPKPKTPSGTVAYTNNCVAPANYVRGTRWKTAHPASGVTLSEGQHGDSRGIVRMHVLRVDTKNPHVRFAPLMRHVADRQRLTSFNGSKTLVAGTNAGYFDTHTGAAENPVVVGGQPFFGPNTVAPAVGFTSDGSLQAATVGVTGTIAGPNDLLPLAGWNSAQPGDGITIYSGRWGAHPVPLPAGAATRLVVNALVASGVGRRTTAPAHGYLLVARGAVAVGWLRSLRGGDHIGVRISMKQSKKTPFRLAWSVGTHLVANGVASEGSRCKKAEKLPARTAIGWSADGRQLILVVIDNVRHSKLHGVEPDQMARIMHDLGAAEAWLFDGGGSSEMVVRPRAGTRLSVRNHPTDGHERRIPVGFGIFRR